MIAPVLALIAVAAVLVLSAASTGRAVSRFPRPLSDADRLAQWELRRGAWRASERLRQHRAQAAFDARASVQPKITPRLP